MISVGHKSSNVRKQQLSHNKHRRTSILPSLLLKLQNLMSRTRSKLTSVVIKPSDVSLSVKSPTCCAHLPFPRGTATLFDGEAAHTAAPASTTPPKLLRQRGLASLCGAEDMRREMGLLRRKTRSIRFGRMVARGSSLSR